MPEWIAIDKCMLVDIALLFTQFITNMSYKKPVNWIKKVNWFAQFIHISMLLNFWKIYRTLPNCVAYFLKTNIFSQARRRSRNAIGNQVTHHVRPKAMTKWTYRLHLYWFHSINGTMQWKLMLRFWQNFLQSATFSRGRRNSLNMEIFICLAFAITFKFRVDLCGSGMQEVFMRQTVQTGKVFEGVNMKIAEKYRV